MEKVKKIKMKASSPFTHKMSNLPLYYPNVHKRVESTEGRVEEGEGRKEGVVGRHSS